MRLVPVGIAALLCLPAQPAIAQAAPASATALRSEGEELGKKGDFQEAIERFKQSEHLEPRAENDCFMAVSYARLNKWTQAKLFIERCRARTGGVPKLAWYGQAETLINSTLSSDGYAAILLLSDPLGASAHLENTPADERFDTPFTLWLPAGDHVVVVEKEGFEASRVEISATRGEERKSEISLVPLTPVKEPVAPVAVAISDPMEVTPTPALTKNKSQAPNDARPLAWIALGGGAASVAGGVIAHVATSSARARALDPMNDYDAELETFKSRRILTVSLYGLAGVLGGVGTYLLLRPSSAETSGASLGLKVEASPSGAWVGAGGVF